MRAIQRFGKQLQRLRTRRVLTHEHTHVQGGPMYIVMAVVFSMFLLTVTGCATSHAPSAAMQEAGKKDSTKKGIKYDERKTMNEESINAIR